LYQGVFRPLVYVGFHLKELLQKGWLVLCNSPLFVLLVGTE
jgi:hypothetical protein